MNAVIANEFEVNDKVRLTREGRENTPQFFPRELLFETFTVCNLKNQYEKVEIKHHSCKLLIPERFLEKVS